MINMKIISALLLITTASIAYAEPKPSDGSAAIKKAQGLIRQLSQEKSALEAEKTAWLQEKANLDSKVKNLEETAKKLPQLQVELERSQAGLAVSQSNLNAEQNQLAQERQKQQALLQKHNEMIIKANAIYADNQLLVNAIREREQWIQQCTSRNQSLQTANLAVLKKYQDKSLLQQIVELEPLTGIGEVATQTEVEDYRYQLQQLKITQSSYSH